MRQYTKNEIRRAEGIISTLEKKLAALKFGEGTNEEIRKCKWMLTCAETELRSLRNLESRSDSGYELHEVSYITMGLSESRERGEKKEKVDNVDTVDKPRGGFW